MKVTCHCIDVSGSISNGQLYRAQQEVLKRMKPQDIVVIFDTSFKVVPDINVDIAELLRKHQALGRGGTCAASTLKFAGQLGAETILYGDGYLITDQLEAFDQFIEIPW